MTELYSRVRFTRASAKVLGTRSSRTEAFIQCDEGSANTTKNFVVFTDPVTGTAANNVLVATPTANSKLANTSANLALAFNVHTTLSGTVALTANSKTVTGTNTDFSNTVASNDWLIVGNQTFQINAVTNATSLTVLANSSSNVTGATAKVAKLYYAPLFAVANT